VWDVSCLSVARLLEIAPHYYDLTNFPKCEARQELEMCLRRMHKM
jgi:hypothetical protein